MVVWLERDVLLDLWNIPPPITHDTCVFIKLCCGFEKLAFLARNGAFKTAAKCYPTTSTSVNSPPPGRMNIQLLNPIQLPILNVNTWKIYLITT